MPPKSNPIVAPEILEKAKQLLATDRLQAPEPPPQTVPCKVCGSEAPIESAEQLCWVCRRLKISAWKDLEQQIPVQE